MTEFFCKEAGRLDQVLVSALNGFSRAQVRALLRAGAVWVNGKKVRTGVQVRAGDHVRVQGARVLDAVPLGESTAPLGVVHEDADLVVVAKEAGMPTAPLRPDGTGTLVNGLVARYPELRGVGHKALEPGILWRLDNDTSGLVVAARSPAIFAALLAAQERGEVVKTYVAVVRGAPPRDTGEVTLAVAHDPHDARRMMALPEGEKDGRPARTRYWVERRFLDHALVRCEITKGARHQIRVHLASLGTPIAGDALYDPDWRSRPAPRHFLHAAEVELDHPTRLHRVSYQASLTPELSRWLDELS